MKNTVLERTSDYRQGQKALEAMLRDAGVDVDRILKSRAEKLADEEAARKAADAASEVAQAARVHDRAAALIKSGGVGLWIGREVEALKRVKALGDVVCSWCGIEQRQFDGRVADLGGRWREARDLDDVLYFDASPCHKCSGRNVVVILSQPG